MRSVLRNTPPAALALGFLLSPESLTKLGNGVGQGGRYFLALLVFAALVHVVNGSSYDRLQQFLPGSTIETHPLRSLLGQRVSTLLPLVTRVPAFVCFGTAVLATAGFVFNEVFVYWFPNFGFAFLLLGCVFVVNFLSPRAALGVQLVCVGISVAGLLALSAVAFAGWNAASVLETVGKEGVGFHLPGVCLTLFMGFELSVYAPPAESGGPKPNPASRFVVAFTAVLFLLWGVASMHFVPMDKLSESSLPHMLASRIILGETGRAIMGTVVLAGCSGVVNGSFLALSGLASGKISPAPPDAVDPPRRASGRVGILLLAAAIASFLGTGLAGEPELDVWLRGSVLLWLMGYIAFQSALWAFRPKGAFAAPDQSGLFNYRSWVHGILAVAFLVMAAVSVWTDPERKALTAFILLAPLASSIILVPWYRIVAGRKREDD